MMKNGGVNVKRCSGRFRFSGSTPDISVKKYEIPLINLIYSTRDLCFLNLQTICQKFKVLWKILS